MYTIEINIYQWMISMHGSRRKVCWVLLLLSYNNHNNPSKSISHWISFQLIKLFSFWYICLTIMNQYFSFFKRKTSHDMVSSVLCKQGFDDKYEHETKPYQ